MKKRKQILLLFCLFLFITVQAQVSKTINVSTPGTLSTLLTASELSTVTDLTITGSINKKDIDYLGWSSILKRLDISETKIYAYTDFFGSFPDNEIPTQGFYSDQNYKYIKLPKTLISIGGLAFDNCSGLDSISFPSTVQKIGGQAFTSCTNLKGKLILPQSLTSIGYETFRICQNLTGSLVIPSSVVEIGSSAFYYCTGFNGSLTLSTGITNIGYAAFYECSGFKGSLIIPSSVTSIGGSAFYDCKGFNGSLIIPSSISTIEANTFQNCSGLIGNLLIPSSITSIKTAAFAGCYSFKGTLSIPSSVISIGPSAFSGCFGLTGKLEIPSSITTIEQSSFENCKGFTGNLSIPSTIKTINSLAFASCTGFSSLTIPSSVTSIGAKAFASCTGFSGSLTIPSSVTTIGESAFLNCTSLSGTITLPKSITNIGNNAFEQCTAIKRIFVNADDPANISLGYNVFYNFPTNTCYLHVPIGKKSLYANAPQWKDFTHIIEGYSIALTITNPTIITNKMVDGNTNAVITQIGTLQGVDAADAGNVGITATATYDNANVGTNKTITVVYTLTGSAKDKYLAPANYVITNAKISDYITLSPLSTPAPGCEGSSMVLPFTLLTGTPVQYKITFNAAALNAGMKNIAYRDLSNANTGGTLTFSVPNNTLDGAYQGIVKMNNELYIESIDYPFTFTINVSSDNILTKFNDLVLFNNFRNRFTGFQWYKNGVEIAGATKQFYADPSGLVGSYSLKLTTTDNQTLYSCPSVLNIPSTKVNVNISTTPNPVKQESLFAIQIDGLNKEQLKSGKLSVYNMQGICVYESSVIENVNKLNLPVSGVYIGHLTASGNDYMFKIIVTQ
jgi:hypothetical protein